MTGTTSVQPAEVQVAPLFGIRCQTMWGRDPAQFGAVMGSACDEIQGFAAAHRLIFTGPPRVIYPEHGREQDQLTVAMPIAAPPDYLKREFPSRVAKLPGGKTLQFAHYGPYQDLGDTYEAITAWMKEEGFFDTAADWASYAPVWEEYMDDPHATPESELLTYIYVPLE